MCEATKDRGAALQDMVRRYRKICGGKEEQTECEKLMVNVLNELRATQGLLAAVVVVGVITLGAVTVAIQVTRRIPIAGTAVALALRIIQVRLQPQLAAVRARQLSNQELTLRIESLLKETLPAI